MVAYNLESACAACQDRDWLGWSQWIVGCSNPQVDGYPFSTAISVPEWAQSRSDLTADGTWNETAAEQLVTKNASGNTSTTGTVSGGSGINGALIGGAIGGSVAAVAILFLIFLYWQRKSQKDSTSLADTRSIAGRSRAGSAASMRSTRSIGTPVGGSFASPLRQGTISTTSSFPMYTTSSSSSKKSLASPTLGTQSSQLLLPTHGEHHDLPSPDPRYTFSPDSPAHLAVTMEEAHRFQPQIAVNLPPAGGRALPRPPPRRPTPSGGFSGLAELM